MSKLTATLDYGHKPSEHVSCTTGYGITNDGRRVCYDCCADDDRAYMITHDRWTGYLVQDADGTYHVTNWHGTLSFSLYPNISHGRHNIAGTRTDVWFMGPDGYIWWAVNYGERSQIAYCRRTSKKA